MGKTKNILQYLTGFLLMIFSLIYLESGKSFVGVYLFLGNVICIPTTRAYIQKTLKISFSQLFKYAFIISCWLCVGIFDSGELKEVKIEHVVDKMKKPLLQVSPNYLKESDSSPVESATINGFTDNEKYITDNNLDQKRDYSTTKTKRTYIRGPRGGCYYINRNGNKTYIDRSFCN